MKNLGFLEMPGGGELLVIIFFAIIFFGAKKIPEVARGLGKGIREFKDAAKGIQNEIEDSIKAADEAAEKKITKK